MSCVDITEVDKANPDVAIFFAFLEKAFKCIEGNRYEFIHSDENYQYMHRSYNDWVAVFGLSKKYEQHTYWIPKTIRAIIKTLNDKYQLQCPITYEYNRQYKWENGRSVSTSLYSVQLRN